MKYFWYSKQHRSLPDDHPDAPPAIAMCKLLNGSKMPYTQVYPTFEQGKDYPYEDKIYLGMGENFATVKVTPKSRR